MTRGNPYVEQYRRDMRRRRILQVVAWTMLVLVMIGAVITIVVVGPPLVALLRDTDVQQWAVIGFLFVMVMFMFFFPDRWDD